MSLSQIDKDKKEQKVDIDKGRDKKINNSQIEDLVVEREIGLHLFLNNFGG